MNFLTKVILLLVLAFTISCRDYKKAQSVEEQMNKIERETGLTFPEKSRLDQFFDPDYFIDPQWVAKIIVPASSYESLRLNLLTKPDDNTVSSGGLVDSTSWWKPQNVVLTKQYLADRQTLVKVVVSKENEEYEVYIECVVF